jgi:cytochrome c
MKFRMAVVGLGLLAMAGGAHAEGDAAKGEKVFKKCLACHVATEPVNKVGPNLHGLIGRKAASVEGYKYSAAMLKKGEEGLIWDEATLTAYLPKPTAYVPGTKMSFAGLAKPDEVADVIAYLKTQTP